MVETNELISALCSCLRRGARSDDHYSTFPDAQCATESDHHLTASVFSAAMPNRFAFFSILRSSDYGCEGSLAIRQMLVIHQGVFSLAALTWNLCAASAVISRR